jgi:hypothetical protein
MGVLVQVENDDQPFLEIEIPCSQWEGLSMLLGVPMCSHQVPQVPNVFPEDVPNSTLVLSHIAWPQFNFYGYNL